MRAPWLQRYACAFCRGQPAREIPHGGLQTLSRRTGTGGKQALCRSNRGRRQGHSLLQRLRSGRRPPPADRQAAGICEQRGGNARLLSVHRAGELAPHKAEQAEDKARRILEQGGSGTAPHRGQVAQQPATERPQVADKVERVPERGLQLLYLKEVAERQRRKGGHGGKGGSNDLYHGQQEQPRQRKSGRLLQQGGKANGLETHYPPAPLGNG